MAHKLLLADDSVTIQRVIELTFADEDVEVTTVGDGLLAIERLDSDPPDIVLADVDMPKRDGYEIAAYVKSRPALAHIPVVLLTGAFEPIDSARAAAAGSNDVLAKPFEPQMVINRVKELLTRKSQSAAPVDRPVDVAAQEPLQGQAAALFASPEPAAEAAEIVSLDDYFDQLDAAFSNLQSEPAPARGKADQMEWATVALEAQTAGAAIQTESKSEPGPAVTLPAAAETPVLDFPHSFAFATEAPVVSPPIPPEPAHDPAPQHEIAIAAFPVVLSTPSAVAAPEPPTVELPDVTFSMEPAPSPEPAPEPAAVAWEPPVTVPHPEPLAAAAVKPVAPALPRTAANPFATLSAAKAEAAARPATPVITDEVIEEVVSRVLQRLTDKVVRETVTDIVSQTAERLVQEEIERIKQAQ